MMVCVVFFVIWRRETKMTYYSELERSMSWLGEKPNTFFLGQSVLAGGTGMTATLKNVPDNKKLETPVFEETQLGMTTGMALTGKTIPISIYPRWNFLLLATNQLVNHLDKIIEMSDFKPKVIIRTSIGSERPLHPFHQHVGDFTAPFQMMCKNIEFIRLDFADQIFSSYKKAYERMDGKSTVLVEWGDRLNDEIK